MYACTNAGKSGKTGTCLRRCSDIPDKGFSSSVDPVFSRLVLSSMDACAIRQSNGRREDEGLGQLHNLMPDFGQQLRICSSLYQRAPHILTQQMATHAFTQGRPAKGGLAYGDVQTATVTGSAAQLSPSMHVLQLSTRQVCKSQGIACLNASTFFSHGSR